MNTHRLIQILGETIGLIALAGASMNCASHDAGHDMVPDAGSNAASDAGPASCNEAKTLYRVSIDGPQTLYVGGDKTMPWTAYCDAMATKKPVEYLDLDTHDGNANFSEFNEITETTSFKVRTLFRKVRIDPANLTIDSADRKFTDRIVNREGSSITKSAVLSKTIDYMPYATAETCGGSNFTVAEGNVDLSSSPFEIATKPCAPIGSNTIIGSSAPAQKFELRSESIRAGSATPTCGRASINCLPNAVNGEVGLEGKIQLGYVGYKAGSNQPGPKQH